MPVSLQFLSSTSEAEVAASCAPEMEAAYQFFISVPFLSAQGDLVPDLQTLILETACSLM